MMQNPNNIYSILYSSWAANYLHLYKIKIFPDVKLYVLHL